MDWDHETYSIDELMSGEGATQVLKNLLLPDRVHRDIASARMAYRFGWEKAPGAAGSVAWQFDPSVRPTTVTFVFLPWNLGNLTGDQRLDALDAALDAPPELHGVRVAIAREIVAIAQRAGDADLVDLEAYSRAVGAYEEL